MVGTSEGGLIAALAVEQHPDVFSAGVSTCAPVGSFPAQINYFGDARVLFMGSSNDFLLNLAVRRVGASPVAVRTMNTLYATTGRLRRPLITMHTTLDQQVPQWHQQLYTVKTLVAGTLYTRHVPITISRFGHCNFTAADAQQALALMLIWDGLVP